MKRTLADELRRTLIANSLQAPEPAGSIEAILGRTVGQEPAQQPPGTAERAAGRAGRRGWTSARALSVAAAVVIALVTVSLVNIERNSTHGRTSASSAGVSSNAVAAPQPHSAAGQGGRLLPAHPPAAGSAGASEAAVPCSVPDSASAVTTLAVPAAGGGHQLAVVTTRCWQPGGAQGPSTVVVHDLAGDRPPITLISSAENLHVIDVYLQAAAGGPDVVVRAAWWNDGQAPWQGAVYEYPFRPSTDRASFAPLPPRLYALSCTSHDVSLSAVSKGSDRFVLRLTNTSAARCAVEGYPQVFVGPGPYGAAGGVRAPVAATSSGERALPLVLGPRGSTTATVVTGSGCRAGGGITVSLPAVGLLAATATPVPAACPRITIGPFGPAS